MKFWIHACYPFNDTDSFALDFTKKAISNNVHLAFADQNNDVYYQYKKLTMDHELAGNSNISFYEGIDNHVFYTAVRCDTIFSITPEGIIGGYNVDFGEQKLPEDYLKGTKKAEQPQKLTNSGYCFNISDVLETDQILSFKYNYKGFGQLSFYDKTTQIVYNNMSFFPSPKATDNNYMVGVYEGYWVNPVFENEEAKDYINDWKNVTGEKDWPLIENLKESDNPLVVFYEIEF